jgi:hypothetical protein
MTHTSVGGNARVNLTFRNAWIARCRDHADAALTAALLRAIT